MKVKILIALIGLTAVLIVIFTLQSRDVDVDQVTMEDLNKDFQDAINQIKEPNIYFITKGKTIILYSNLSKSGLYTYPYVEIKRNGDRLIVQIKSHLASDDAFVKEILIASIKLKHLPKVIEASFLDRKTNYKIINLDD